MLYRRCLPHALIRGLFIHSYADLTRFDIGGVGNYRSVFIKAVAELVALYLGDNALCGIIECYAVFAVVLEPVAELGGELVRCDEQAAVLSLCFYNSYRSA